GPSQVGKEAYLVDDWHVICGWAVFVLTVVLAILVERLVSIRGRHWGLLAYIHIFAFALPFLIVLFLALTRFNGINNKRFHRRVAYTVMGLYLGIVITGLPLLYRL